MTRSSAGGETCPPGTHSPERPVLGPRQPPDHTARRDPPRPVGAAWPQANGPGWRNKPDPALCLSVCPAFTPRVKSARPGSLYVASTSPCRAWPCTPTGGPTGQDSLGNERRAHHSLPWISPVTLIKAEKDTGAPRVCECSGWGEDAQELGSQLAGLASEVQQSEARPSSSTLLQNHVLQLHIPLSRVPKTRTFQQ